MEPCPCGSGRTLAECCQPVIAGTVPAATAEALMRSRYSAFVLGEVDYILESNHSSTRDQVDRDEIERWSRESQWQGLEVLDTQQGGEHDDSGVVDFHARYVLDETPHDHFERATFRRENGVWRFLDAKAITHEPIRREGDKVGRNDPCPCGSGRKYKKCCGAADAD